MNGVQQYWCGHLLRYNEHQLVKILLGRMAMVVFLGSGTLAWVGTMTEAPVFRIARVRWAVPS